MDQKSVKDVASKNDGIPNITVLNMDEVFPKGYYVAMDKYDSCNQDVVLDTGGKANITVLEMDEDFRNDGTEEEKDDSQECDEKYVRETRKLRKLLKLNFYATFKLTNNTCSFHSVNIFLLLLQVIKIVLITLQMIDFGYDRGNFSDVINRGHYTLRHLFLEKWDASWETLPYPPGKGEFAVYTVDDLESGINHAVSEFYNAEKDATGYFVRTDKDSMKIQVKYFDFPGFYDAEVTDAIQILDKTFHIEKGLSEQDGRFTYNISKELEAQRLKQPMKRMLSTTLHFSLNSVRVHAIYEHAICLHIKGQVTFNDMDNNGQVLVNLETLTNRLKCRDLNLTLTDWALENTSKQLGGALIVFCLLSILATAVTIALAGFVFWRTKQYMKVYYRRYYDAKYDKERDLPASEYRRFIKVLNLVVIISDILTLYGTVWILFENEQSEWLIETLDSYIVWLAVGCFLAWISMLRFFKFHIKFHLLYMTLRHAFWDVIAYLLCVIVLFVGFWICGFVVLGPYHVKFRTPGTAAETLLSIVSGDEIFTTFAILESYKSGGNWMWWFLRCYLGAYIFVFTIVIINLLIAIYMSAYESIRLYYAKIPEERDLGSMEKALRRFLMDPKNNTVLRASMYDLIKEDRALSTAETGLKKEMKKLVRVSGSRRDVEWIKPRTLTTFMKDEEDKKTTVKCGCVNLSVIWFFGKD